MYVIEILLYLCWKMLSSKINPCGTIKDAGGVDVLMRLMVMAKFKRCLDIKDIYSG